MHSALKHKGVPLYELARRGEVIEREPRRIVIEELSVTRFEGTECNIQVRCSKGTYIRVLAEDIGKALGCGAHLSALRRTGVSCFDIKESTDSQLLESLDAESLASRLLPIDAGLAHLPLIELEPSNVERLRFGQAIRCAADDASDLPMVRLYVADSKKFVGLGGVVDGIMRGVRLAASSVAKIT
jgi:tRNA pseudouridine55 synthase